jgi:thiol-disulfide isomerase/thioredoxin
MKTNKFNAVILLALTIGCPAALRAIDLGDPAPALSIDKWVKGGPVDLQAGQGKHIYVVEFWATWCPPCRTSIPHLTQLQRKFNAQNVVIIGISDEEAAKVEPFVKSMADKMGYTVALDKERETFGAYMGAFDVNSIPHAFVINKMGKIVWHGHPMARLDKVLEQIVAGTFDMAAAQRIAKTEKLLAEYYKLVSTSEPGPDAEQLGRRILRDGGDNPELLNQFAWTILTHRQIKHRDLTLATEAAKSAYDATKGRDAAIADTYARALFDTGKVTEAIAMQKHAIEVCQEADLRGQLEDALDRYLQATRK